jgi:hypothetical protein
MLYEMSLRQSAWMTILAATLTMPMGQNNPGVQYLVSNKDERFNTFQKRAWKGEIVLQMLLVAFAGNHTLGSRVSALRIATVPHLIQANHHGIQWPSEVFWHLI